MHFVLYLIFFLSNHGPMSSQKFEIVVHQKHVELLQCPTFFSHLVSARFFFLFIKPLHNWYSHPHPPPRPLSTTSSSSFILFVFLSIHLTCHFQEIKQWLLVVFSALLISAQLCLPMTGRLLAPYSLLLLFPTATQRSSFSLFSSHTEFLIIMHGKRRW